MDLQASHPAIPVKAWGKLSLTAAAGSSAQRFTQADIYCDTFVVIGSVDVLYGPGVDKALIPAFGGVPIAHPPIGTKFNLRDWFLADTAAGGQTVTVLYV